MGHLLIKPNGTAIAIGSGVLYTRAWAPIPPGPLAVAPHAPPGTVEGHALETCKQDGHYAVGISDIMDLLSTLSLSLLNYKLF
jgi:hypothetical protein